MFGWPGAAVCLEQSVIHGMCGFGSQALTLRVKRPASPFVFRFCTSGRYVAGGNGPERYGEA